MARQAGCRAVLDAVVRGVVKRSVVGLLDAAEVEVPLRTEGQATAQGYAEGSESAIDAAAAGGGIRDVARVADQIRVRVVETIAEARVAVGHDAHHHRGVAPQREGHRQIVDVEGVAHGLDLLLLEQFVVSVDGEIRHEGEAVPRGHGSGIHHVDETGVAQGDTHAAHRLVVGSAGLAQVADTVDGIRGVGTRSLPVRADCSTHGQHG